MCDLCIQVIDEKLAEGMSKRFGSKNAAAGDENDNQNTHEQQDAVPKALPPDRNSNRAVLTLGRYRYACPRPSSLKLVLFTETDEGKNCCAAGLSCSSGLRSRRAKATATFETTTCSRSREDQRWLLPISTQLNTSTLNA